MKTFIDSTIEGLNELAKLLEKYPEYAYVLPSGSTAHINAFDKFKKFFDSELNSVVRSWDLIEDQTDIIFVSGTRADQVEAAKRLAKQLIQPALPSVRLTQEACRAGMTEAEYVDRIAFPDALILAMAKMDELQTFRDGRKWKLDQNGNIWVLRPVQDLTVAEFLRLLHREASRASRLILLNQPDANDALSRLAGSGSHAGTDPQNDDDNGPVDNIDQAGFRKLGWKQRRSLLITPDVDPTRDKVVAAEAREDAKGDVAFLFKNVSPKEQELLNEALSRGGDLLEVLRERGYGQDAIRQIRRRFRMKIAK
jgi:hypothetical protein